MYNSPLHNVKHILQKWKNKLMYEKRNYFCGLLRAHMFCRHTHKHLHPTADIT